MVSKNLRRRFIRTSLLTGAFCVSALFHAALAETVNVAPSDAPRIVNIYNFIRNSDYRLENSREILFEATQKQIELIKPTGLPVTWALQYDALINPRYQKLLKEQAGTNDEIAAWWEIPRPLAEKAGLKWRGHDHEWDSTANVGFSPGFTPDERRTLVDVYMADFKEIFGYYPRTVGSWFIDEVTLEYMATKYGIIASCNCKDQVGTDGYTLWGGYWNQAYYPSRVNSYMPAQTEGGQINVPIFRMLGSDPIYQHGTTPGLLSLEPVYRESGGSAHWVAWFMRNMIEQPSLAFAYTQAGQENSFGWPTMGKGLIMQIACLDKLAKAGEIQVKTLAEAGEWFRNKYSVTPPTAVVVLDDWKNQNRRTVWYNSRFYRLNILWENGTFFIRDIHCFDESIVSPTHTTALKTTFLAYETLPIVDRALWFEKEKKAGMWPVLISADGSIAPMRPEGDPTVTESSATELTVEQPLQGGGIFKMEFGENSVAFTGVNGEGQPLLWAWNLVGGEKQSEAINRVEKDRVIYRQDEITYSLQILSGAGSFHQLTNGVVQLRSSQAGKISLNLNVTKKPGQKS